MSNPFTTKDPLADVINQVVLGEKKLTDAELKKREEIAKAMERDNPGMDMGKKMAIATATAKKVAEEAEQIDEASYNKDSEHHKNARKAAKSMGGKAKYHPNGHASVSFQDVVHGRSTVNPKGTVLSTGEEDAKRAAKSHGGKAVGNVVHFKEEAEQIDEISDKTLGNYVSKAVVDVHNDAKFAGESGSKDASKKAFKRLLGVKSAAARLSKQNVSGGRISNYRAEEVEQIDELSKKTTGSYLRKATIDYGRRVRRDALGHAVGGDTDVKNFVKMGDRAQGISRAIKKLTKEEVNLDEQLENFWEAYTTMFNEAEDQQQNMLLRAMAKDPSDLMKMKRAIKMGDKALTNPALRQEILKMLDQMMTLTTGDKSLLQRTRMGFQKAKTMKMPALDEAIGAKDKQDEGEYGYEGDMAMSQLRTIIRNCQEMMKVLDKETDMPEWVQSKITLATDYLQTANDYLMSELEEAVGSTPMNPSYRKIPDTEAKDAPFEGGREVKSSKSAAERVKKIAKGMEKLNTPKVKK